MDTPTPTRFAELAAVTVVGLWLTYGLLSNAAVVSAVLTFAALPLLVVVLPALLVRAADTGGARVELSLRYPAATRRSDTAERPVPLTDGGDPESGTGRDAE